MPELDVIDPRLNGTSFRHLYVHVPFCRHKCGYCDFNAYAGLEGLIEPYLGALESELYWAFSRHSFRPLSTVYFGGGTPSLVPPAWIARLLVAIRNGPGLKPDAEVTLEANPASTDPTRLAAWREAGVNRLSLGVQGFDPRVLAVLERRTDGRLARQTVREARAAGFENISLDLIYGVPGQGLESWQETVAAALEVEPDHLSCYCLTLEPGTPLHRRAEVGSLVPANPDQQAEYLAKSSSALTGAAFHRYEVSSWARAGFHSRHNLCYWSCRPVYGAGCGAHSYARSAAGARRWWNESSPRRYVSLAPSGAWEAGSENLDLEARGREEMMLSLRTRAGVLVPPEFERTMRELASAGLVTYAEGVARTTERGLDLNNQVAMAVL